MFFQFQKRCRICKAVYYSENISKEAFEKIANNQNFKLSYIRETHSIATIESICDEHRFLKLKIKQ